MNRRRGSLPPLAAVVLCVGGFSSAAAVAGEWVAHNDGLRNLTVNGIGIAASDPNTIYIQARSLGVHKSTDGGGSWNKTATFNNNGPGYDHIIHEGPAVHPADPHHPGRFALSTQWGGLWYSTDHGATWQRISSDSREGNIFYRPLFSTTHSGNLYVNNGSYYTWRFENYYNDGTSVQQIGQTLSYSSVVMSEDPFDLNRLYACIYDLGISIYDDEDIAGEPAPPVAVAIDLDHDGDIDQSDFGLLQVCFSGPGVPQYDRGCVDALIDDDDDVDTGDLMLFLDCMSGPGVGPDPACDCFRP